MPVRIRLGDNYYTYATLEHMDRDLAAAQVRARQLEKDLDRQQRDVARLEAGRVQLVAEQLEAQRKYRARLKAERVEKRLPKPETYGGEG